MIEDTQTEVVDEVQAEAPAAPAPSLSLNDLANLKQIIEVVSQRGAFRPDEMQVVGSTYTKLAAFLQSVVPATRPAEETAEEEQETAEA